MAKPIVLIRIGFVEKNEFDRLYKTLEQKLSDYYVIIYCATIDDSSDLNMQVFYDKDIQEIDIEEIREMIKKAL